MSLSELIQESIQNPLQVRMQQLLAAPCAGGEKYTEPLDWDPTCAAQLGITNPSYHHPFSNCHGTTLWLVGYHKNRRPGFVPPHYMDYFLSACCREVPEKDAEGKIVSFWFFGTLQHTGILSYEGKILHQPDTSRPFCLEEIRRARRNYFRLSLQFNVEIRYFQPTIELHQPEEENYDRNVSKNDR